MHYAIKGDKSHCNIIYKIINEQNNKKETMNYEQN